MRRAFRLLILLSALLPLMASGATLRLSVLAPTTNASNDSCGFDSGGVVVPGAPLTDLKELVVMGRRFSDPADSLLGVIPASGMEGDSIAFDLEIKDRLRIEGPDSLITGSPVGRVWVLARDFSGNLSCRGPEYVFAFPAIEAPEPPPPPANAGLLGSYYTYDRWTDFKAFLGERVDTVIAFDWGAGSAWPGGSADYYSIRWTGNVIVPTSGDWTFYVNSNDGARLWIDGVQVQNFWLDRNSETASTIMLAAGAHAIRLEYYEGYSAAKCFLSWSGPGVAKQVVPSSALGR